MTEHAWQVSAEAAEVYEAKFVPATFGEWAPRIADAVAIERGHRVLDVACGTGVAARECARRGATDTGSNFISRLSDRKVCRNATSPEHNPPGAMSSPGTTRTQ